MQSNSEATSRFGYKSSIGQKDTRMKGKENSLTAPCLQPDAEKLVPKGTPKSRLPILAKAKEPPDFQKLHEAWENQFQKGKVVKKRTCTRPQPFNFSQKADRSRVTTSTEQSVVPQARRREPLAEVTLGQKNEEESKDFDRKGGSEEFQADGAALASILSNIGVPAVATGKFSIAQRVPMRVSSTAQSSSISNKPMVRSSMYAAPRSQSASSNLDRMSCFSTMQTKERLPRSIMEQPGGQKPLFKANPLLKSYVPDSNLKLGASNLDDELQSQENPVLQQMKKAVHAEASSVLPPPLGSQEITAGRSTLVTEDAGSSVSPANKCEENKSVASCTEKRDPMKKAGSASAEFVADLQALASILSNTGVTTGNYGKFSLAQRVPVQGRSASLKGSMTFSGTSVGPAATPKPCLGRLSTTMAVSMKDMASSPFRVPKILMPDKTPSESAKRVHQLNASARKFSQWYSPWSKQPFFPKTPRALALEMANKKLESELSDTQPSARSKVKWADELSPMTETLRANEPRMEQVAMRLFLDGECPGETDKKEPAEESSASSKASDCLTARVQKRMEAPRPENSNNAAIAVPAGVLQDLSVHTNTHPPAALSLTNVTKPSVQYPSISCTKTTLPLSFLSHPAVKALQSSTLGPCSLPDIARLRIQASVSANQRFWETCLDEECAFYTSRRATGSYRNCTDPVSSYLDKQEDLHFNPIIPGEP